MDTITYQIGNGVYINLTNKCSNDCVFCERNRISGVEGYYLWLKNEPTAEMVIENLKTYDLPAKRFASISSIVKLRQAAYFP